MEKILAASIHLAMVINREKCECDVPEVQFLGHYVTAEGIMPLEEKLAAIQVSKAGKSYKEKIKLL